MTRVVIGIVAVLLGAAFVGAEGAATPLGRDAAAKCPKGKVAWRIGGLQQCLPASSFAPRPKRGGASGSLASRLFDLDLHDEWSKSLRTPVIERLLAMSPRGPAEAVGGFRDVASAFAVRGGRSLSGARGDLPPGYTLNPDGSVTAVKDLGDGVQLAINGRGTGHTSTEDERKARGDEVHAGDKVDDRYTEQQTETTISKNGASIKLTVIDGGAPASVDVCPNGHGEVVGEASDRTKIEATAEGPAGRTATAGYDDKWHARFDGQVGDDAHLEYFDVVYDDVLVTPQPIGRVEIRTHIAARVDARAARRGPAGSYTNWQGTTTAENPDGSVSLSAADRMSFAGNRANAFSKIVEKALDLFDRAEKVWYDADESTCVDVRRTPEPKTIKPSRRVAVNWTSRSKVDHTQVPGRWDVSQGPYQGTVDRMHARSEPHAAAEIAFTAANHFAENRVIGYDVLLTSHAGRGRGSWHVDPQEFPYRYEVLNVSFETHARGKQTVPGGFCADSSGTRDFTGRTPRGPTPSKSRLDRLANAMIVGTITAQADAEWSNDVLHGCNVTATGAIVPCTFTTPPRKPRGGREAIVFAIDAQKPKSTITGHWLIWSGEIGFASGYTGACGFVPHIDFAVPYGDLAKSYPLKIFWDGGPHTISFSGSKRFSSTGFIEQSLDYDWKAEVTFRRI
jgi:hypothetical protein